MPTTRKSRSRYYPKPYELDRLGVSDKFNRKPGDMRSISYRMKDYGIIYNPKTDKTTIVYQDHWPVRQRIIQGDHVAYFQQFATWKQAFEGYKSLIGQR